MDQFLSHAEDDDVCDSMWIVIALNDESQFPYITHQSAVIKIIKYYKYEYHFNDIIIYYYYIDFCNKTYIPGCILHLAIMTARSLKLFFTSLKYMSYIHDSWDQYVNNIYRYEYMTQYSHAKKL